MAHSPAIYIVFVSPPDHLPLVTISIDEEAIPAPVIGESSTDAEVVGLIMRDRLSHSDLCRWMDDGGAGDDPLI